MKSQKAKEFIEKSAPNNEYQCPFYEVRAITREACSIAEQELTEQYEKELKEIREKAEYMLKYVQNYNTKLNN